MKSPVTKEKGTSHLDPRNYWPGSVASVLNKIMEQILPEVILKHMEN